MMEYIDIFAFSRRVLRHLIPQWIDFKTNSAVIDNRQKRWDIPLSQVNC